jgi:hypothetical protein
MKMTQYQQVLDAMKVLGKGTPKEIYAKIKEKHSEWGTKTPIASVSGYLSKNNCFKSDDGVWRLQDDAKDQDDSQPSIRKKAAKPPERGLYFITLSPYIRIHGAGFLFKVGKSDDAKSRLEGYSAALPIDTIQVISFYPIPSGVDLREAEKEVNGELLGNEELGNDEFGRIITVRPYFGNHQREWLQTLDITLSDENSVNKLARVVDTIVKSTIDTLSPKPNEELLND